MNFRLRRAPSRPFMLLALAALSGAAAMAVLPAAAQAPSASQPSMQQLIERLQPGPTRGIRLPAEPGAAPAGSPSSSPASSPASAAGAAPSPARAPRTAAATSAPGTSAPGTTAPPGVPAASLTVLFATGSATLTPQAERLLDVLGQALTSETLAPYRFRIEGHTDTVGDTATNQELSQRRADAVREYLVRRFGLAPTRLEVVGLGESQPLVRTPDQTPEPRNRRVQVVNLGA